MSVDDSPSRVKKLITLKKLFPTELLSIGPLNKISSYMRVINTDFFTQMFYLKFLLFLYKRLLRHRMQAQPNKNISEKVSPESGTARDAEKDGLSGAASAACARCVYMVCI